MGGWKWAVDVLLRSGRLGVCCGPGTGTRLWPNSSPGTYPSWASPASGTLFLPEGHHANQGPPVLHCIIQMRSREPSSQSLFPKPYPRESRNSQGGRRGRQDARSAVQPYSLLIQPHRTLSPVLHSFLPQCLYTCGSLSLLICRWDWKPDCLGPESMLLTTLWSLWKESK